jgi:hypothetical protein
MIKLNIPYLANLKSVNCDGTGASKTADPFVTRE